jgi:ribosomal protein L11 methyltransferase
MTAIVDGFVDGVDTEAGGEPPEAWSTGEADATPLLIYGSDAELSSVTTELDASYAGRVTWRRGALADTAWQQAWQQDFAGLETRRFVVGAPGVAALVAADRLELRMMGGGAFGGGDHATTEAMLFALEDLVGDGSLPAATRVLDLGTGTGVLAIAAAKLGAGSVVGTDLDAEIIREAGANAAANHADIDLRVMDKVPAGPFDLVMANILVPVLHQLAARIKAELAPSGTLVLAGFIDKDVPALVATYAAHGLTVRARREVRGWLALTLKAV